MVTSGPSISISDTDAYFIIRNCTLESTTGGPPRAIVLDTVRNGVIENCTLAANKAWGPGMNVVFGGVCLGHPGLGLGDELPPQIVSFSAHGMI